MERDLGPGPDGLSTAFYLTDAVPGQATLVLATALFGVARLRAVERYWTVAADMRARPTVEA